MSDAITQFLRSDRDATTEPVPGLARWKRAARQANARAKAGGSETSEWAHCVKPLLVQTVGDYAITPDGVAAGWQGYSACADWWNAMCPTR